MGAQFNIKNAEVIELAEDVARQLGVSKTEAVRMALQAHRRSLTIEQRVARVKTLVAEMRPLLSKEFLEASDPTAFLYDEETGLPV